MQNEFEPVANRDTAGFVLYVCQVCGGYQTLIGASDKFLLFIDHLIGDLAQLEHPKLKRPCLMGDQIWYQLPETNEIICGLPPYKPDAEEWKRLLEDGRKILPQATLALFSCNSTFSTEFKNRGISFCKLINNFHFDDIKIIFREFPARIQKAPKNPHFSFLFSFSVPQELSHFEIGGAKRISRHLSGPICPAHLQELVSDYATVRGAVQCWAREALGAGECLFPVLASTHTERCTARKQNTYLLGG